MAFLPVLWNRAQPDFDDLFQPMGWGFGLGYRRPIAMMRTVRRRPETKPTDKKWTFSVMIGDDFKPQHVKVKVENGKVIIHAKYNEGNDEWGDTVERRRTVQIPENVDSEKVHTYMKYDGSMMLEAPYIKSEERQLTVVPSEGGTRALGHDHLNLMKLSVKDFSPREVKISCKDGVLTAQGHRERSDDGLELKEYFFRRMPVPRSVDAKDIRCFRGNDGSVTIRAPNMWKVMLI